MYKNCFSLELSPEISLKNEKFYYYVLSQIIHVLSTVLKMSCLLKKKEKERKYVTKSRKKHGRITKEERVQLAPKYNQITELDGSSHCTGQLYGH